MEKDNQSTQEINSQVQNPLGIAPVGGLIAKFAIPAIISMLVSAMYNIVDQIFIGQGVGMGSMALRGQALAHMVQFLHLL